MTSTPWGLNVCWALCTPDSCSFCSRSEHTCLRPFSVKSLCLITTQHFPRENIPHLHAFGGMGPILQSQKVDM